MKRYISAILIPCLLLQLYGCYSWRVVEKPEPDSHIKIYIKNNQVIEPKNWHYENGNFIFETDKEKLKGYKAVKVETMLDQKKIYRIEEEYLNITNTSLLVAGIILFVGLLVYTTAFIDWANDGFK
ncbi:MAG TPA: hypothetical protein VF870_16010 [Ignavibacteriaceae bacterium]